MKKLLSLVTATALLLSTLTFGAVSHAEPTSVTLPEGKTYLSWDTKNIKTCSSLELAPPSPYDDPDMPDERWVYRHVNENVTTENGYLKITNANVGRSLWITNSFIWDYELFKYVREHPDCQLGFTVKTISAPENLIYFFDFNCDNNHYFLTRFEDTDTQKEHLVVFDGKNTYETFFRNVSLTIGSTSGDVNGNIDVEISPVVIFNENISTDNDYIVKANFKNPYDYGENLLTDWSDMKYIRADGKDISDKVKWYQSGLSVDTGVIEGGFKKITAEFNIDSEKFTKFTSKQSYYEFRSSDACFVPYYVKLTENDINYSSWYQLTLYNSKNPENAVQFNPNQTYFLKDFKDCVFDTMLVEIKYVYRNISSLNIDKLDFTLRPIYANFENVPIQPTFEQDNTTTTQTYAADDLNKDGFVNIIDVYAMLQRIAKGDHEFTVLDMRKLFLKII